MAKSRKGSRKAASTARRSPKKTKSGARKATRKKAGAAPAAKKLEFRKLRTQLEQAVAALERKKAKATDVTSIDDAQRRLERWMADIGDFCSEEMQEICGPTMDLEMLQS